MNITARQANHRKSIILLLTILFVIAAGTSIYWLPQISYLAPLIVLAGIGLLVAILFGFTNPAIFTYITLILVLLPTSLIPTALNSQLNRLATAMALFFWLINTFDKKRSLVITATTGVMLVFLIWSAISLSWAGHFSEGLTTLQVYIFRFLFFMVVLPNVIRTRKDLDGLQIAIVLSGLVLAAASLMSVLRGYVPGTRLQVLDENSNAIGTYLLISGIAAIWWAQEAPKQHKKIKILLAAVFLMVCIALTGLSGSRGSAISWAVTLIALLVLKQTRAWGIFALVAIGIAAIAVPSVFETTINRFLVVEGDTMLGGREYIWPAAWELIKDHTFFGVGIGNSFYEIVPYLIHTGDPYVILSGEPIHNPVFVLWAETGLFGLFLYLGILLSAAISFLRQWIFSLQRGDHNLGSYYALTFSLTAGFLLSWIKGGGMENHYTYFLVLSLLLIPSVITQNSSPGDVSHE